MYDDVISSAPADPGRNVDNANSTSSQPDRDENSEANGAYHHVGNNLGSGHIGRRYQLYVGNLTWVNIFVCIYS